MCWFKDLNTGHWLQLEARDEVNKQLDDFFSDIEGKEIPQLLVLETIRQ